jgi:hypothetical protein
VSFDFETSAVGSLRPGERLVVVKNLGAFTSRYDAADIRIAGEYVGNLSNAGERLSLRAPGGETILEFAYDDAWYPLTDGEGHSLVVIDASRPQAAWSEKASWRSSRRPGGSPGEEDAVRALRRGWQLPGDANQDGLLDVSDAIRVIELLFGGAPAPLPCDGGLAAAGGNRALLDLDRSGSVQLTDAVSILLFLFAGGPPGLGTDCVLLVGCPDACVGNR